MKGILVCANSRVTKDLMAYIAEWTLNVYCVL